MNSTIPVAILGATGSVGQKFIELLADHPYFTITAVAASEKSAGKKYRDAVNWILSTPIPERVSDLIVQECRPNLDAQIAFSGLDASAAGEIETIFASAGYHVVSNSKNHRWDADVPLLIPEVNPDHLQLIKSQKFGKGSIVTNPNCSTIGLVMALKPLHDLFGLERVNVVTMQAISGAGYPGVAGLDILDNVVPFIGGEEAKLESEPKKILGKLEGSEIRLLDLPVSAQCNRVGVLDGHTEAVQISLKKKASAEEIIAAWNNFRGIPQEKNLPLAPLQPVRCWYEENYPQPRKHRNIDKGMATSVGRLRPCSLFDYKFSLLSHNTIRGAAGGAILCAELMKSEGYI